MERRVCHTFIHSSINLTAGYQSTSHLIFIPGWVDPARSWSLLTRAITHQAKSPKWFYLLLYLKFCNFFDKHFALKFIWFIRQMLLSFSTANNSLESINRLELFFLHYNIVLRYTKKRSKMLFLPEFLSWVTHRFAYSFPRFNLQFKIGIMLLSI